MTQRMTKTSIENLKVADTIGILKPDWSKNPNEFMVWIQRNDRRAFLSGGEFGTPIIYKSIQQARRNIKRVRPDLELTEI